MTAGTVLRAAAAVGVVSGVVAVRRAGGRTGPGGVPGTGRRVPGGVSFAWDVLVLCDRWRSSVSARK